VGQRQEEHPYPEDEHARDGHPHPAEAVHDPARRIEEEHVDGSRDAEDEAGAGGIEPDRLGPQRHERGSAGAGRGDEHRPHPERGQGALVLEEHGGDRPSGARASLGALAGGDVRHDEEQDERRCGGDEPDDVCRAGPPPRDDGRPDEGAHEHPDPVDATEGGQGPGPQRDRDGLSEVGLSGQAEDRTRDPDEQDRRGEHAHRGRRRTPGHPERLEAAGHDQGRALADPGGEGAGREVAGELADPEERDHERRDVDPSTEVACGQDDDGQHGAGADRAEGGRTVGRERHLPQGAHRLGHPVTLGGWCFSRVADPADVIAWDNEIDGFCCLSWESAMTLGLRRNRQTCCTRR